MPNFSKRIRNLLFGSPFGATFPQRQAPLPPAEDGRTTAIRTLFLFISELTFFRSGGKGQAEQKFQILSGNMYAETPPPAPTLKFPSIGIVDPDVGKYLPIGLTSFVDEETRDKFGRDTVVQWQSEYQEMLNLEIWSSSRAERRAIISGLEQALVPTEQMYGIRFRMPDYFDQQVCFTLDSRRLDDSEAGKGRFKARMILEMRHHVVALVNANTMKPATVVRVDQDEVFDVTIPT